MIKRDHNYPETPAPSSPAASLPRLVRLLARGAAREFVANIPDAKAKEAAPSSPNDGQYHYGDKNANGDDDE
ncbi:MAG: hypothetical protein ACTSX7_04445 [Alphaproteobacteria bacterium]